MQTHHDDKRFHLLVFPRQPPHHLQLLPGNAWHENHPERHNQMAIFVHRFKITEVEVENNRGGAVLKGGENEGGGPGYLAMATRPPYGKLLVQVE